MKSWYNVHVIKNRPPARARIKKGFETMTRMTIAQLREKDVERLSHYNNGEWNADEPSEEKRMIARRLMNSYYRLNGLAERNFYYSNDSRLHDKSWVKESEEKEDRWYKRLRKEFKEYFGLDLYYSSFYVLIGHVYERGSVSTEIYPKFYD